MHDALTAQLLERIANAIGAVNRIRANHLENARLEGILTQLELANERVEAGDSFSFSEREALNFHLTEGTPIEGEPMLVQELYSLKNILDTRVGPERPGYTPLV